MDIERCELLITGFIRDIEELLDNQIIPGSLNTLCFDYFYTQLFIIAVHNKFIRIGDLENDTNWKYDIIQSPNCSVLPLLKMENAAVCYAKNVILPSYILNELNKNSPTNISQRTYNIVFHANRYYKNGYNNFCRAYIMNPSFINKSDNVRYTVFLYETKLPPLPNNNIRANDLIFSHKTKQLISIGGIEGNGYTPTDDIYALSFDDDKFEWISMQKISKKRSSSSSIFVDGNKKLMVIGGQGNEFSEALNCVEIYDIMDKKWKKLDCIHHERMSNGVCYDEWSKTVYIGGGFDGEDYGGVRIFEYYDMNKNKWYKNIPNISCNQDYYPSLWIQDHNILNIASITARSIETIDLRENTKKWNVSYDDNKFDNIFDQHLESSNAARYRLFV